MPKIVAAFGCLNVSICCLCRIFVFFGVFFWGGATFSCSKPAKWKTELLLVRLKHQWRRVESLGSITKREDFGSRRCLKHIAVIMRSLLKGSSTGFLASSRCALVVPGVFFSHVLYVIMRMLLVRADSPVINSKQKPELHHLSSPFHLHLGFLSCCCFQKHQKASLLFCRELFLADAGVCV